MEVMIGMSMEGSKHAAQAEQRTLAVGHHRAVDHRHAVDHHHVEMPAMHGLLNLHRHKLVLYESARPHLEANLEALVLVHLAVGQIAAAHHLAVRAQAAAVRIGISLRSRDLRTTVRVSGHQSRVSDVKIHRLDAIRHKTADQGIRQSMCHQQLTMVGEQ